MTTPSDSNPDRIDVREVAHEARLHTLPRHFGKDLLRIENTIFNTMSRLAPAYTGAYWSFFELSNGGFYMAPCGERTFRMVVDTNGFEGELSADAAGITVCLFAFSQLSFELTNPTITDHFHWLREFALQHAEARLIFSAID